MPKHKIEISVLSAAPSVQLADAGLSTATLTKFDKLAGAIITSFLHGLISPKAFRRGTKILKAEIRKAITTHA